MKFEFIVKHNKDNANKAMEVIDNLKNMARNRGFDLSSELDIQVGYSEKSDVIIVPKVTFNNDEYHEGKSADFHKDYLEKYANSDDVFVDYPELITLE